MAQDRPVREQLLALLRGGNAHITLEDATRDFPVGKAGIRIEGLPYSAWELLEHMRIAQRDILDFSRGEGYEELEWPAGYWPPAAAPANEEAWHASARAIAADRAAFERLIEDSGRDLHEPFPWGDGQTLLREALLIADHNSYHLGQLVLIRRKLGAWDRS